MHIWLRLGARLPWGDGARRRLAALAERGDRAALTAMIGLARRGHAREWLADRWVATRDERLRAAVLETGAVASHGRARQITLALHGRLAAQAGYQAALNVAACAEDADETVRGNAHAICATATGPLLDLLWRAAATGRPMLGEALLANPAKLSGDALMWAWRAWLDQPAQRLWDRLAGQGEPAPAGPWPTDPHGRERARVHAHSMVALGLAADDRLCSAAVSPDVPEQVRLRAEQICMERGLVPDQPVERALFHLLTGATERYRALDPDGSLLAAGRARLRGGLRDRLSRLMTRAGDESPAHIVTDGEPKPGDRREAERLARGLLDSEAWAELWRLFPTLPFEDGLAAIRRIRGWRPPDAREAGLFDLLTRPLPAPAPLVIGVGQAAVQVAFTAGGARLYIADAAKDVRAGINAEIYSMWRRERVRSAVWHGARRPGRIIAMAASGAGFAALSSRGHLLFGHKGLREVALGPLTGDRGFAALAAHRRTGRLAVLGRRLTVLDRDAGRVVAAGEQDLGGNEATKVAFLHAQRMVLAKRDGIAAMNTGDPRAHDVWAPFIAPDGPPLTGLAAYDGGTRLAMIIDGAVVFAALDFVTGNCTEIDEPRFRRPGERVTDLWSSPGGEYLAVRAGAALEVHGPFIDGGEALLKRPLAELSRVHLAEAARLRARFGDDSLTGRRYGLLHACLAHKYDA
ncbi:hypothetical protein [Spongiactinospora sp. 9N601]|uniref:hypothetical protein n=1 Tax=Spongiactinospora sp. 9N601 TaxID=3375149 RepID=UPI00379D60C1